MDRNRRRRSESSCARWSTRTSLSRAPSSAESQPPECGLTTSSCTKMERAGKRFSRPSSRKPREAIREGAPPGGLVDEALPARPDPGAALPRGKRRPAVVREVVTFPVIVEGSGGEEAPVSRIHERPTDENRAPSSSTMAPSRHTRWSLAHGLDGVVQSLEHRSRESR